MTSLETWRRESQASLTRSLKRREKTQPPGFLAVAGAAAMLIGLAWLFVVALWVVS